MPRECNRWAIVLAHYLYCADHHNGIGCPLYERLSRITGYYRPGLNPHRELAEDPIAQSIYDELVGGDK